MSLVDIEQIQKEISSDCPTVSVGTFQSELTALVRTYIVGARTRILENSGVLKELTGEAAYNPTHEELAAMMKEVHVHVNQDGTNIVDWYFAFGPLHTEHNNAAYSICQVGSIILPTSIDEAVKGCFSIVITPEGHSLPYYCDGENSGEFISGSIGVSCPFSFPRNDDSNLELGVIRVCHTYLYYDNEDWDVKARPRKFDQDVRHALRIPGDCTEYDEDECLPEVLLYLKQIMGIIDSSI